jgi:hypothetical protein
MKAIDFKEAYTILASLIDRSVNYSNSEESRMNAHRCAYLFKFYLDELSYSRNPHLDYRWNEFAGYIAACNTGAVRFINEYIMSIKVADISAKF